MIRRLLAVSCVATLPFMVAVRGQTRGQLPPASIAAPDSASQQRALLNQYCVGCHSQRGKASGQEAARKITLDDLDVTHVGEHAEAWERVVRKLRAGMMPPAGARRRRPRWFGTGRPRTRRRATTARACRSRRAAGGW